MKFITKILFITMIIMVSYPSEQNFCQPYTFPGIVGQRKGEWVGSDHLFNLTNRISIAVDIEVAGEIDLPITKEEIIERAERIFANYGIVAKAEPEEGKPALPMFHLLIMAHSVPEGVAFSIDARLFEEVDLERIELGRAVTMQAITWDRQSINIASTNVLKNKLDQGIDEMIKGFAERFQFFENLKK